MKYNDDFVLPPNEILNKMNEAYHNKKVFTESTNSLNNIKQKEKLEKEILQLFSNYYLGLESLYEKSKETLFKQKLSTILYQTKIHISTFKKNSVDKLQTFKKPLAVPVSLTNKIKYVLLNEQKVIKVLLEYYDLEHSVSIKKIIKERFSILHQLISFL